MPKSTFYPESISQRRKICTFEKVAKMRVRQREGDVRERERLKAVMKEKKVDGTSYLKEKVTKAWKEWAFHKLNLAMKNVIQI